MPRWCSKDQFDSPRLTCLPTRLLCIRVALSDPPHTPLQYWLVGRTSPTRLVPRWTCLPPCQHCTGVALELHSKEEEQAHLGNFTAMYFSSSSSCNSSSRPPQWNWSSTLLPPRWTTIPTQWPRVESTLVHRVQLQSSPSRWNWSPTRLEAASLDFNFTSMDLIGVCGRSPYATPLKSIEVILKSRLAGASLDFKITSVDLSLSWWSPAPNNIGLQLKLDKNRDLLHFWNRVKTYFLVCWLWIVNCRISSTY